MPSLEPALPRDGVLLTDYLADLLDVRPGDTLDVEFLEGHRRTLAVPVAGTVREYLGVGAYARRRNRQPPARRGRGAVRRLARAAPGARPGVVGELRERPRIAAVTDRARWCRASATRWPRAS